MHPVQTASLQCPYCGEQIEMVVDCTVGDQNYVEDCGVCCQPIMVSVVIADDDRISIEGRAENA